MYNNAPANDAEGSIQSKMPVLEREDGEAGRIALDVAEVTNVPVRVARRAVCQAERVEVRRGGDTA